MKSVNGGATIFSLWFYRRIAEGCSQKDLVGYDTNSTSYPKLRATLSLGFQEEKGDWNLLAQLMLLVE
jgi:hypothetical protein